MCEVLKGLRDLLWAPFPARILLLGDGKLLPKSLSGSRSVSLESSSACTSIRRNTSLKCRILLRTSMDYLLLWEGQEYACFTLDTHLIHSGSPSLNILGNTWITKSEGSTRLTLVYEEAYAWTRNIEGAYSISSCASLSSVIFKRSRLMGNFQS